MSFVLRIFLTVHVKLSNTQKTAPPPPVLPSPDLSPIRPFFPPDLSLFIRPLLILDGYSGTHTHGRSCNTCEVNRKKRVLYKNRYKKTCSLKSDFQTCCSHWKNSIQYFNWAKIYCKAAISFTFILYNF